MVDLAEFVGDVPERRSLMKKKEKAQERVEKLLLKLVPLQADVEMYDEMIAAIDKRLGLCGPAMDQDTSEIEESEEQEPEKSENKTGPDNAHQAEESALVADLAAEANIPPFLRKAAL